MSKKGDRALFDLVADKTYKGWSRCPHCGRLSGLAKLKNRPSLACYNCGYHFAPLSETKLFRKSTTPLKIWRIAYQLIKYDENVSAMNIMRVTGITYKTAWRLRKLIKEYPDEAKLYLSDEQPD